MASVDPFLLTLTLVMTLVLIVANVYLVAHYAHAKDSAFGTSTACKAVIVCIFILFQKVFRILIKFT